MRIDRSFSRVKFKEQVEQRIDRFAFLFLFQLALEGLFSSNKILTMKETLNV